MIYQQQLIIIMNLTNWVCYVCLCVSSPMRQLWIRSREFSIRWQPSGARRMRSCNWNWRTARWRAASTWWRSTCWRRKARITWWLSARRTKPSQVLSNLSITADHNLQAFEERKIWFSVINCCVFISVPFRFRGDQGVDCQLGEGGRSVHKPRRTWRWRKRSCRWLWRRLKLHWKLRMCLIFPVF